MPSYLLFESREPFESAKVPHHYQLAAGLKAHGDQVILFLVQNGVTGARRTIRSDAFAQLIDSGVEVLADDFSLRERGIPVSRLAAGVKVATMDEALDKLAEGHKALWL